jgi:arylsulfatase
MKRTKPLGRTWLALALAFVVSTGAAHAQQKKPNIVIIWGDDVGQIRYQRLSMGLMGFKNAQH